MVTQGLADAAPALGDSCADLDNSCAELDNVCAASEASLASEGSLGIDADPESVEAAASGGDLQSDEHLAADEEWDGSVRDEFACDLGDAADDGDDDDLGDAADDDADLGDATDDDADLDDAADNHRLSEATVTDLPKRRGFLGGLLGLPFRVATQFIGQKRSRVEFEDAA
jgi:hypothetical protein